MSTQMLNQVMTLSELRSCKNLKTLRSQRQILKTQMMTLLGDGSLTWEGWEARMDYLDFKLDGIPLNIFKSLFT